MHEILRHSLTLKFNSDRHGYVYYDILCILVKHSILKENFNLAGISVHLSRFAKWEKQFKYRYAFKMTH